MVVRATWWGNSTRIGVNNRVGLTCDYGEPHRSYAASNTLFREHCKAAGVQPTRRQASKYRRGMGLAYKSRSLTS